MGPCERKNQPVSSGRVTYEIDPLSSMKNRPGRIRVSFGWALLNTLLGHHENARGVITDPEGLKNARMVVEWADVRHSLC